MGLEVGAAVQPHGPAFTYNPPLNQQGWVGGIINISFVWHYVFSPLECVHDVDVMTGKS